MIWNINEYSKGLVTSHRLSISSSPIEGATAVVGVSSKRYLQSKLISRSVVQLIKSNSNYIIEFSVNGSIWMEWHPINY